MSLRKPGAGLTVSILPVQMASWITGPDHSKPRCQRPLPPRRQGSAAACMEAGLHIQGHAALLHQGLHEFQALLRLQPQRRRKEPALEVLAAHRALVRGLRRVSEREPSGPRGSGRWPGATGGAAPTGPPSYRCRSPRSPPRWHQAALLAGPCHGRFRMSRVENGISNGGLS